MEEQEELPITADTLEVLLRQERQRLARAIDTEEWQLLRKVRETKEVIAEKNMNLVAQLVCIWLAIASKSESGLMSIQFCYNAKNCCFKHVNYAAIVHFKCA